MDRTKYDRLNLSALIRIVRDLEERIEALEYKPSVSNGEMGAIVGEIADELRPDRYISQHKGRGRYTIINTVTGVECTPPEGAKFFDKAQMTARLAELNA